ncbi:MAG: hypothetical protein AB7I38_15715 [Dehalococcoidia bacterium]
MRGHFVNGIVAQRGATATFGDPNLVSCAGLVPVMCLAQSSGPAELVAEHVSVLGLLGAKTSFKIGCAVAGMIAGADSIDDLDVLRRGGMGELSDGVRAPSTLGSFLRALSWGNVGQLEAVDRRLLAELAAQRGLGRAVGLAAPVAFQDLRFSCSASMPWNWPSSLNTHSSPTSSPSCSACARSAVVCEAIVSSFFCRAEDTRA